MFLSPQVGGCEGLWCYLHRMCDLRVDCQASIDASCLAHWGISCYQNDLGCWNWQIGLRRRNSRAGAIVGSRGLLRMCLDRVMLQQA